MQQVNIALFIFNCLLCEAFFQFGARNLEKSKMFGSLITQIIGGVLNILIFLSTVMQPLSITFYLDLHKRSPTVGQATKHRHTHIIDHTNQTEDGLIETQYQSTKPEARRKGLRDEGYRSEPPA